ncbi:MAG: TAXI family TRAP transporter solute-binding subunit [Desulfarculus sp.]|nr:TAXI family TRAP transporter solute-binding subunit [Desulfarculus sp.]
MGKATMRWALAAILALGWGAAAEAKTTFIAIGTGGTGGVFYPYGGGMAEVWSRCVPGVKAMAEVTGASVENVKLTHRGETAVGLAMGDVAHQAYHGEGFFKGKPQGVLAMAAMYPNVLHVVTLKGSGIKNLTDFKGRKVSIGAPGSGTTFMSETVLRAVGVTLDSFDVRRLSFSETAIALRDRAIDAGVWVVAPGANSLADLAATHDIELVSLTPEQQKRVSDAYGFYASWVVEPGDYRGVDHPVPTVSVWNVVIVQAALPEDLVYDLAKTFFEQNAFMQTIHSYARFSTPANTVAKTSIPLHPGAVRCLREKGVAVPERLLPPAR